MSKWVTFYTDIFGTVADLTVHNNKEDATKFFKNHYKDYFELAMPTEVRLPMTYGYPHRKFVGISKPKFEKLYGKIDEKEVLDGK